MTEHTTPPRSDIPGFASARPPSFGGDDGHRYMPVEALCGPRYDGRGRVMREIWKYRDMASQRDVAVKLIPTAGDGELVASVERDGAALTADVPGVAVLLDHQLLDGGTPGERLALISQFVTGVQLDELEQIAPERALRIARSLTTSVAALHAAGVVHGDVKPSNVIVRDSDDQPVLVDAGSARRSGERLLASSRLWEPPEAGDEPRATPAYDCWSLGLILAGLAGFRPDPGDAPAARGERARADLARAGQRRLRAAVDRLLDPAPDARTTAAEARRLLEGTARSRRRYLVALTALTAVVIAGGIAALELLASGGSSGPPVAHLIVSNKLVFGATGVREDTTPAALSTLHVIRCQKLGCTVAGTNRQSGGTLPPPVCQVDGDLVTNGSLSDPSDDSNPRLVTSNRWYGVSDGKKPPGLDYISEVWIRADQRGGLGLPQCAAWLSQHD